MSTFFLTQDREILRNDKLPKYTFTKTSCVQLTTFGIKEGQMLSEESCTEKPTILVENISQDIQGTFLGTDYDKAIFISQDSNEDQFQSRVLKWLNTKNYLTLDPDNSIDTSDIKKPDFICMGLGSDGILIDQLETFVKLPKSRSTTGWEFYGCKYNGVIFLFKGNEVDLDHQNPENYYRLRFREILRSQGSRSPSRVNEYEKDLAINQVQIGDHKLIVSSEIDGFDHEGKVVGVRLHKEFSSKPIQAKYTRYWAKSIISGIDKLIIGQRDYRGRLQSQEVIENPSEKILTLLEAKLTPNINSIVGECFQTQNRFLTWVKHQFKSDSEVKSFSWSGPSSYNVLASDRVICETVKRSGINLKSFFDLKAFTSEEKVEDDLVDENNNN